jgi:hypothetical protein
MAIYFGYLKCKLKKKKQLSHFLLKFFLVMESGGGDQRLAACSEGERDSWIEVLHRASYSYIRVSTI